MFVCVSERERNREGEINGEMSRPLLLFLLNSNTTLSLPHKAKYSSLDKNLS